MEIKINKIEMLTGKDSGNPYWRLETNKGKMSCFDKEIADRLYNSWRQGVECYVDAVPSKDGKYINIRKIMTPQENADYEEANKNYEATMGMGGTMITPVVKPYHLEKPKGWYPNRQEERDMGYNPTSMYVSYAKDIFIAIEPTYSKNMERPEIMGVAINLVKQAHKAFS